MRHTATQPHPEKKTLSEWREAEGLTRRDLAELAGVTYGTIEYLETRAKDGRPPSLRPVADALGIAPPQILPPEPPPQDKFDWREDGHSTATPPRTPQAWRETRGMSMVDLARLSGVHENTIKAYETAAKQGVNKPPYPSTRSKIAKALRVSPDKIIWHGKTLYQQQVETAREDRMRAEIRAHQRVLREVYDFLRNDAAITFRYMDARDILLAKVENEIRGT